MTLKNTIIAASSLAGVAVTPSAFGFAEFARGVLVADAQFSAQYDSNIFANSNEEEDLSAIFAPSLSYTRNAGQIAAALRLGVTAMTFDDNSDQDSFDPSLSLNLNYDRAEKGAISQLLSYARQTEANDTLNTRVESDEYRGATRIDHFYSEKTGLRVNAGYRLSDFSSTGYNDVWSYNVGGGIIYRYSPKLLASATYDFSPEKATNLNGASDPSSKNHRLQFGLEGSLAPKVSGSVGVGVAYRDFDEGGSDSTFLMNSAVTWAAAEKTEVSLSASNNFDTTPGAESAQILSVSLAVRQQLTTKVGVGASVGYQHKELDQVTTPIDRTDHAYLAGLNASYLINDNWTANGSLSYRINESTLAFADYDRFIANLGLSLHF